MSFWWQRKTGSGRRSWYSVSVAIPALIFFAVLLAMGIARLLRGVF